MKVNAISNYNFSNIQFEGKKQQEVQKPVHSSNPIKALPVAVLIAMSPLNAPNTQIAQAAIPGQIITAISESPQKTIYQRTYKTQRGYNLTINAINTKDNSTNFDKIVLKSGKYEFDVKNIYDSNLYLNSVNGVKEGPLNFYEVKALDKTDGSIRTFTDPNVAGYVAALVQTENNKSKLKIQPKTHDLLLISDYDKPEFVDNYENGMSKIPWKANTWDKDFGKEISAKRSIVKGSNGEYTLRFYDNDKNMKTPEVVTIQKKGEDEYRVHGIFNIKSSLISFDNEVNLGFTKAISLYYEKSQRYGIDTIMDDILADKIVELLKHDNSLKIIHTVTNNSDIVL